MSDSHSRGRCAHASAVLILPPRKSARIIRGCPLSLVLTAYLLLACSMSGCAKKTPGMEEIVWAIQNAQADYYCENLDENGVKHYWKGPLSTLRSFSPSLDSLLKDFHHDPCPDPMGLQIGVFYIHPIPVNYGSIPPRQLFAAIAAPEGCNKTGGMVFLIVGTPSHVSTYAKEVPPGGVPSSIPDGLLERKEVQGWTRAPGRVYGP